MRKKVVYPAASNWFLASCTTAEDSSSSSSSSVDLSSALPPTYSAGAALDSEADAAPYAVGISLSSITSAAGEEAEAVV